MLVILNDCSCGFAFSLKKAASKEGEIDDGFNVDDEVCGYQGFFNFVPVYHESVFAWYCTRSRNLEII